MHAHAGLFGVGEVVAVPERAAQADLHAPARVDQALLEAAPHGRGVGDLAAVELVQRVGVRVELDDAERRPVVEAAQARQRDRGGRRRTPSARRRARAARGRTRPSHRPPPSKSYGWQLTSPTSATWHSSNGFTLRRRVDATDDARRLADGGGRVPGAWPVGEAEVERDAEQRDVDPLEVGDARRAHERRDVDEAGDLAGVDRHFEPVGTHANSSLSRQPSEWGLSVLEIPTCKKHAPCGPGLVVDG